LRRVLLYVYRGLRDLPSFPTRRSSDLPDGSAELLDADQVARGIAEGAVAKPVRLLGRLLDDVGAAGLQPLEGAVEVLGGQEDDRSEEHTSELQSHLNLVCRLLLEKKKH